MIPQMNIAKERNRECSEQTVDLPGPGRLRGFLTKCALLGIVIVLNFVALEVGLRAIGRYRINNPEGYFERGGISYVLKKNVSKEVRWPTMSFTVYTSDLGFRAKAPGRCVIGDKPYYVALGASDVFGNGLDYEKTFVGILDEKLERHGIDVINMGVAGHHLQEQIALFKQFVSSSGTTPKAVILFFNPLLIGGYDDNHTNVVVKRGDLFPDDNWRLALLRKTLSNSSAAYCFFRDSIRSVQRRFSPGEEFALSFYVEKFSTKHRIRTPEKSQDFLRNLDAFEQYIRGLKTELIYVYCPPAGGFLINDLKAKGKVDPASVDTQFFVDLVQGHAQSRGIRCINLEPPVQQRYDKGEKLNFDSDGHYNGPTSQLVGDYLYKMLAPVDHTAVN
jgi:hypothetical protein